MATMYLAPGVHPFVPNPWGHDLCDAKLDDGGRVRTCNAPQADLVHASAQQLKDSSAGSPLRVRPPVPVIGGPVEDVSQASSPGRRWPMSPDQETAMLDVIFEIALERKRQHARWGEQNLPDDTGEDGTVESAALFRKELDDALAHGGATWRQVLREEVFEAFAESHPVRLREELVQVCAVACQWVEALDRRQR